MSVVYDSKAAIVQKQMEMGGVSQQELLAVQSAASQARASVSAFEKELARTRNQIMLLAGQMPEYSANVPEFDFSMIPMPESLPESVSSLLVRQRPDIRAAEALLHSACAQVGVATANLYPQITLSGSYGSQAGTSGNLFDPNSVAWNLGAGLLQPVFRGGALRAQRRAAVAAYDQAAAGYRQTVLAAFGEVSDVFKALEFDDVALRAQQGAAASQLHALQLARAQREAGAMSELVFLDAQLRYEQSRVSVAQAKALRLADVAALFQALGGGWWSSDK
jgi:NodT family efflux transporter outer membrane factor (OMF) lipoprotein